MNTKVPIVFLHGFLGNKTDWNPLLFHLSEYECIPLNLPGHGDTPFCENLVVPFPRFHLVGYSMGGRLAMSYAKKHKKKIASLHIISAHPGLQTDEEKQKRFQNDLLWAEKLLTLSIDRFLFEWYNQPVFGSFKPDLSERKKQNIEELKKAFLHFSLAHQPRFHLETAIVGKKDEKFKSFYKNPILIPDAGHMVHLENPKALAKVLDARIKRGKNDLK